MIGGTNGQEFFADVYELDLRSLEWRDLAPAATGGSRSRLTRRSRHTTVAVTDGRARQLIIYGGINPDFRKRDDSSDVFILDLPEGALPRWVKPYSANPGRRPTPRCGRVSERLAGGRLTGALPAGSPTAPPPSITACSCLPGTTGSAR